MKRSDDPRIDEAINRLEDLRISGREAQESVEEAGFDFSSVRELDRFPASMMFFAGWLQGQHDQEDG